MAVFVKFWGCRGSIPTPASWTRVYGGNTSCVEVRFDKTIFICDAGSGIRELGKDLATRQPEPTELHLLITHTHWDHIQGFPFFSPAYAETTRLRVYGKSMGENSPHALLSGQMISDYFPVSYQHLGAQIISDSFQSGGKEIEGVCVRTIPLNHPGGCTGYIFEKDGKKIVYLTDNELEIQPGDKFPDLNNDGPLRRVPQDLIDFVRHADLLIADAQYDDKEYVEKRGWGHSSCVSVTDLAIKADVKNLALFHHDPECSDSQVDEKVRVCCERAVRFGANVTIFAAREGIELKF
ncbi:MAG: MBL fold metallo-hydrolase [Verrucomicrobia bacterium]|nr:MBL fold metallo-hydrolase [Verrucomicrobiota bacterium]